MLCRVNQLTALFKRRRFERTGLSMCACININFNTRSARGEKDEFSGYPEETERRAFG